MENVIHIVGCCNQTYLQHLITSFKSAEVFHRDLNVLLHFHVLHESDVDKNELEKARLSICHSRLSFYPIPPEMVSGLGIVDRIPSLAAWYRCLIPEVLPSDVEKVIYLDCDTVVVGDLQPLYRMELKAPFVLGAVQNSTPSKYCDYIRSVVGDLSNGYFNSGVLLMSLPRLREMKLREKVFDYAKGNYCHWLDQCALNAILVGRWQRMPLMWNMQQYAVFGNGDGTHVFTDDEIAQAIRAPAVVHFEGGLKPWSYLSGNPYRRVYINFKKQTMWRKQIYSDFGFKTVATKHFIRPVKNSVPAPLKNKLKEIFGNQHNG